MSDDNQPFNHAQAAQMLSDMAVVKAKMDMFNPTDITKLVTEVDNLKDTFEDHREDHRQLKKAVYGAGGNPGLKDKISHLEDRMGGIMWGLRILGASVIASFLYTLGFKH